VLARSHHGTDDNLMGNVTETSRQRCGDVQSPLMGVVSATSATARVGSCLVGIVARQRGKLHGCHLRGLVAVGMGGGQTALHPMNLS
jgi:hypothetical protein